MKTYKTVFLTLTKTGTTEASLSKSKRIDETVIVLPDIGCVKLA